MRIKDVPRLIDMLRGRGGIINYYIVYSCKKQKKKKMKKKKM